MLKLSRLSGRLGPSRKPPRGLTALGSPLQPSGACPTSAPARGPRGPDTCADEHLQALAHPTWPPAVPHPPPCSPPPSPLGRPPAPSRVTGWPGTTDPGWHRAAPPPCPHGNGWAPEEASSEGRSERGQPWAEKPSVRVEGPPGEGKLWGGALNRGLRLWAAMSLTSGSRPHICSTLITEPTVCQGPARSQARGPARWGHDPLGAEGGQGHQGWLFQNALP